MLRRAVRDCLRASSAAPVGLHSGEIASFQSLLHWSGWAVETPRSTPAYQRSFRALAQNRSAAAAPPQLRARHASGETAAEKYDLVAPDTGIVRIDGYDGTGFIVGDVQVEGPIICFSDLWLQWHPPSFDAVTIESLSILDLVKPIPDLVVLGCGTRIRQVPVAVMEGLRARGVAVEALDTANAVAYFNILNQEGRKVVGALIPAGIDDE